MTTFEWVYRCRGSMCGWSTRRYSEIDAHENTPGDHYVLGAQEAVVVNSRTATEQIDAIDADDPEVAHATADAILLANVDPQIAAAYERLVDRCRWWATA